MSLRPLSSGSRSVRCAVRNPPGPRATSEWRAPGSPRGLPAPPGPPTYDLRAAVAAGVLEACLALLVRPVPEARVLNLQGRDGPKIRRQIRGGARPLPAAPIRASRVCGRTAAGVRLPLARLAASGSPGTKPLKLFSARAHSGRAKASAPPTRLTSHSRLSFLKNSSFSNLLLWSGTTRGIFPPSGRGERPRSGLARAAAGGLGADRLTAHPRRLDSRCSLFQEPARVGSRSRESEVRPSA